MLELELEQCRTSYQREYERTQERLAQLEAENIELCKSIDENTIDQSMKSQVSNVIQENLVSFHLHLKFYFEIFFVFIKRNFINKLKQIKQKLEN